MDCAFWSAPHRWPVDLAGHVFLARAYDQIGRARFPDEWTGKEAITLPPRQERKIPAVLPTVGGNWPPEQWREHLAVFAITAHVPQRFVGCFHPGVPERIEPAEELSEDERARRVAALVRRDAISRLMLEKAAAGVLKLVYVATDNSAAPRLCPRKWWQTTFLDAWPRFWACRIDPLNPISSDIGGSAWLFVTRKSLQAMLAQLGPQPEERCTKSRAGRKKGSAFANLDAPLVAKMRSMLERKKAATIYAASLAVATQAKAKAKRGDVHLAASVESITRRLTKAFRESTKR